MSRKKNLRRGIGFVAAFTVGLIVADRFMAARLIADDSSTTAPTSAPATSRPVIPADAQAILDRVTAAYAGQSLDVTGTLDQDFDVAGIVERRTLPIRGTLRSPTTFRHEAGDDLLVVADGTKATLYDPRGKRYRSTPIAATADAILVEMLTMQNPALAVAVAGDAGRALVPDGAGGVRRLVPAAEGGRSFDRVGSTLEGVRSEAWVGREDGRIDRVVTDFADALRRQGAAEVKRASVTLRYAATTRPAVGEAVADARFAFAPPADARDVAATPEGGTGSADATVGRPAPAFALKDLDGREVKLADDRGHVVVLDFWATWCGPCRQGMPHLAAAAKRYADRGVRVYAVNGQEDAATVRGFLDEQKLTSLRTLMDADGAVAGAYGVEGIPHTVVIDGEGKVRQVLVGFGPGSDTRLDAAIEAALGR